MSDQKLEELVTEYADLAKDKNIDAAALLLNALEQKENNNLSPKTKRWAYLVSVGVPPFGLIFAIWFYFSGKDDGKTAGMACLILTIFSSILAYILLKATLSGTGGNSTQLQQLQQIQPKDVYELTQ